MFLIAWGVCYNYDETILVKIQIGGFNKKGGEPQVSQCVRMMRKSAEDRFDFWRKQRSRDVIGTARQESHP